MKCRMICALAAAALMAGCGANPAGDPPIDASVTLQPARTLSFGSGASLRFDGVDDSRCPTDVQCVWAGMLNYKFTLTGDGGTESFSLNKDKPAFEATAVRGARIALGQNSEPPVRASTDTSPAPLPSVTLRITRP